MRVALVHDWLNGMRGGEKVLEQLCLMYPGAVVHTLLYQPDKVSEVIRRMEVRTSFVGRLPWAGTKYRWYLPLFPAAVEGFDLGEYDLVISSSHCVALGARARPGAVHVCYCHTPMRYAYEHFDSYFPRERYPFPVRAAIGLVMARMRRWDRKAAGRVSAFVANSECVAGRVERRYGRKAGVVYPPVDTEFFTPGGQREGFFLVVSALVPYKRVDLAVRTFGELSLPLYIVGDGPERDRLEAMASPAVKFLGWRSPEEVRHFYRRARALVFPGEEDFGLTPLEAAACGTPTIALARGGALETVKEGVNGVFFREQTEESLARAVGEFADVEFDGDAARRRAMGFGIERFRREFAAAVAEALTSSGTVAGA